MVSQGRLGVRLTARHAQFSQSPLRNDGFRGFPPADQLGARTRLSSKSKAREMHIALSPKQNKQQAFAAYSWQDSACDMHFSAGSGSVLRTCMARILSLLELKDSAKEVAQRRHAGCTFCITKEFHEDLRCSLI